MGEKWPKESGSNDRLAANAEYILEAGYSLLAAAAGLGFSPGIVLV